MRARIAVLASGSGTNLQAVLDHFDELGDTRAGDVVLVASNRAGSGAQSRAAARGIATAVLRHPGADDADELGALFSEHRIDLVVLAGYLQLVPTDVVRRYAGRMLNVHPSLLPAFGGRGMYGTRVHRAVLDSGVTVTGVTIHLVTEEYDRGPIVAQWPVPVCVGDDPATLAARVLRVEHVLFPRVVASFAATTLEGRPRMHPTVDSTLLFTLAERSDRALGDDIASALRS